VSRGRDGHDIAVTDGDKVWLRERGAMREIRRGAAATRTVPEAGMRAPVRELRGARLGMVAARAAEERPTTA
jgi:hypothetical protein